MLAAFVAQPACVVTDVQFQAPPSSHAEGVCMCSLCWTEPFCFDPTRPEGEQVYMLPCDSPEHEAEEADRVDGVARVGGFYCVVPDDGKRVGGLAGPACPEQQSERERYANLDPCVDLPPCARPEDECGVPQEEPACPEVSPAALRSVCVANPPEGEDVDEEQRLAQGAALAVNALAATCAGFGGPPPDFDSGPARYCYLSCVTPDSCTIGDLTTTDFCETCDDGFVRSQSLTAFPVEVSPVTSTVRVYAQNGQSLEPVGALAVEGQVDVDIPSSCFGPVPFSACEASLRRMRLDSIGSLSGGGDSVSDVHLLDLGGLSAVVETTDALSALPLLPPARFSLTGTVNGEPNRYLEFVPAGPIQTWYNWVTRQAMLSVQLESVDGTVVIQVEVNGSFASITPRAVASAQPQTLECGRTTVLKASSSTDPDGDLQSARWSSEWPSGFVWQSSGDAEVQPPLGTHRFHLVAGDAVGNVDFAYVDVTVQDTLPPQLEIPADQVVYACAPPTVQLLPRRLEDSCDFEPEMDIRLISVNGIAANVPYTPQLRFPFGRTLVRYTATDDAGNSVSAVQTVDVERGDSCCPAGALKFIGNASNNTLNGNANQPSCLVGYDGADRLYGNLRFDTLLGGRGDDLLEDSPSDTTFGAFVWGGIGNDTLRSRSPASTLLGGPGDDVVFFTGSTPVRLRGGAGKDTLESTSGQQTTFVVGAACELISGERWRSTGPARIESPVSLNAIQAAGVILQLGSPVTFVSTPVLSDRECF
jgi:hypothetical protein